MKNKLIVVSGCPRSGTSLMMDCLRMMLKDGENRLIGFKFPILQQRNDFEQQKPTETEDEYNIRMYIDKHFNPDVKKVINHSIQMNPNGFFEHPLFSVSGLNYNLNTAPIIKDFQEHNDKKFAKIVSHGLNNTCPEYISSIIFMLRPPEDVAKSQEALIRNGKYKLQNGKEIDLFEGIKINDPTMFINVTISAAKFFIDNPKIPVTFVKYNELVEKPYSLMQEVFEFIDEIITGQHPIDKSLKRSYSEKNTENQLFVEANKIYEMFCDKRFSDVVRYGTERFSELNKQQKSFFCLRVNQNMNSIHCSKCKSDFQFRNSLKKHAEQYKIQWKNQPCVYECAYANNTHKTIQESIDNNFWNTPDLRIAK